MYIAKNGNISSVKVYNLFQIRAAAMNIKDLPKWMNVIPTFIGVALAIIGMYVLPLFGIRNTWGPIIGLPLGLIIGVAILANIAKNRG